MCNHFLFKGKSTNGLTGHIERNTTVCQFYGMRESKVFMR